MKNLFSILAVIFCAVALTSCKTTEPEGNQVQGITLNKPFDLAIGETRTIIAKVIPETALDKSITWTSSDDKIATVDKKGVVKGIAIGKIVITATAVNSVKASCEVNIIENAIFLETLKFKNDTVIIDMGQNRTFDFSKEIQMFPEDANANTTIEWFVSLYSSYIEIDKSTGIATMLQATGTETYAEIVAKAGSITDTCRVAILDASTPLIGDFFYSDQTFSTELNTEKTCIGVVFCTKNTPTEGTVLEKSLIAGLDVAEELTWSTNATLTNANNRFYGWKNVETLKAIDNTLTSYPAAKWCDDKQGNWYLPAAVEWARLHYARFAVDGALQALIDAGVPGIVKILKNSEGEEIGLPLSYWTSTEGYNPADAAHFEKEAMFFRIPLSSAWYTDKTKPVAGDMKISVRAIMAF